jgi:SAM-dependent methyltransferase
MGTITWGPQLAAVYDRVYASSFSAEHLDPVVDLLADLADGRPVLELGAGTGRVALPLSSRGLTVTGIELSPDMAAQLLAKPGAEAVDVVVGDMATTRAPVPEDGFGLVYLVANTLMNVTTQDEQVAVLRNAAGHLGDGGLFVLELVVPAPDAVPRASRGRVFTLEDDHVGIETYDDPVGQIAWSHHWMEVDGVLERHSAPYRYIWPSELVLMARLAGLRPRDRWADWRRTPFTADSRSQVAVFVKDGPPAAA